MALIWHKNSSKTKRRLNWKYFARTQAYASVRCWFARFLRTHLLKQANVRAHARNRMTNVRICTHAHACARKRGTHVPKFLKSNELERQTSTFLPWSCSTSKNSPARFNISFVSLWLGGCWLAGGKEAEGWKFSGLVRNCSFFSTTCATFLG